MKSPTDVYQRGRGASTLKPTRAAIQRVSRVSTRNLFTDAHQQGGGVSTPKSLRPTNQQVSRVPT